jgi:hypothetical protein
LGGDHTGDLVHHVVEVGTGRQLDGQRPGGASACSTRIRCAATSPSVSEADRRSATRGGPVQVNSCTADPP